MAALRRRALFALVSLCLLVQPRARAAILPSSSSSENRTTLPATSSARGSLETAVPQNDLDRSAQTHAWANLHDFPLMRVSYIGGAKVDGQSAAFDFGRATPGARVEQGPQAAGSQWQQKSGSVVPQAPLSDTTLSILHPAATASSENIGSTLSAHAEQSDVAQIAAPKEDELEPGTTKNLEPARPSPAPVQAGRKRARERLAPRRRPRERERSQRRSSSSEPLQLGRSRKRSCRPQSAVKQTASTASFSTTTSGASSAPTTTKSTSPRPWQSQEVSSAWAVPTGTSAASDPAESSTSAGASASASRPLSLKPQSSDLSTAPSALVLTSNNAKYGPGEVRADLKKIMKWAYDEGNLSAAEEDEVIAGVLSASARYFPEVPTRAMCRIMLADIKAESDFQPRLSSAGRLDSGASIGLLQVSPGGSSQELKLWKAHAKVSANTFSWSVDANANQDATAKGAGALLDWKTGSQMRLAGLSNEDVLRPWVNIHLAMWVQSNSARTSSQDPYNWAAISAASSSASSASSSKKADSAKVNKLLVGAGLNRSVRTGLGSWVAGAATNGPGSYKQKGDDISEQYIDSVLKGVSVLYGKTMTAEWLDGWVLNAGLVDYR